MTITKTNFLLITCAIGVNGLFAAAAETSQENFLNSLYVPGKYSTTIETAETLPGITPRDSTVLQQSWMCLPAGFDTSSVVLTTLPDALRGQVDAIANAGSFLALKLQGFGDNPVKTDGIITALEPAIKNETNATNTAALQRALDFTKLIRDIDTALQTRIGAQETEQVNSAVDNTVQNIIKLVGDETNLNMYLNFKNVNAIKAYVKSHITGTKANKPTPRAKKARNPVNAM